MFHLRLLLILALCALLARPAQAQLTLWDLMMAGLRTLPEAVQAPLVPLEVGNQWTYKHFYANKSNYLGVTELRVLYEIPESEKHHADYLGRIELDREFTIEITHTEWIEGFEYFVFSHADYDWPPIPAVFWAGQKVRLSDEGVLLFRWNGEDIPLYDFNPQHPSDYSIPAYPFREDVSTKLVISREGTTFELAYPEIDPEKPEIEDIRGITIERHVELIDGRGLRHREVHAQLGGFCLPEIFPSDQPVDNTACFVESHAFFANILSPVSVSYSSGNTRVQSSSWGQLKDRFGPSSPFIR